MKELSKKIEMFVAEWTKTIENLKKEVNQGTENLFRYDGAIQAANLIKAEVDKCVSETETAAASDVVVPEVVD